MKSPEEKYQSVSLLGDLMKPICSAVEAMRDKVKNLIHALNTPELRETVALGEKVGKDIVNGFRRDLRQKVIGMLLSGTGMSSTRHLKNSNRDVAAEQRPLDKD